MFYWFNGALVLKMIVKALINEFIFVTMHGFSYWSYNNPLYKYPFCRVAIVHHLSIHSCPCSHVSRNEKFKLKLTNWNLMQRFWICQTLQYLMIVARTMKILYRVANVMITCQKLRKRSIKRSRKVAKMIWLCLKDIVTLDQGREKFVRKYTPICLSCFQALYV